MDLRLHSECVCACQVILVMSNSLCGPMDCGLPGSSVHGIFPGKNTGVGGHFLLGDLPDPGIKATSPRLLHLQADSLSLSQRGSSSNEW